VDIDWGSGDHKHGRAISVDRVGCREGERGWEYKIQLSRKAEVALQVFQACDSMIKETMEEKEEAPGKTYSAGELQVGDQEERAAQKGVRRRRKKRKLLHLYTCRS